MEHSKAVQQITQQFKCPICGAISSFSGLPGEHLVINCNSCGTKGNAIIPQTGLLHHDDAIEISHLTKVFGEFTAVDDVSFSVKKGEIFGLLGPNGAGKSTIIRMLCTLTKPTRGSAKVAGYDVVRQNNKVREHIGLVSEKLIMYDQLTARENLTLFGRLYNIPDIELDQRIEELLRFVRMEKWADQRIDTFSTGMKQRINVIRALVNQPEILFLDEPTLGLDPQSTVEIRELTKRINAENGTTIILTTHIMVEADILCNRIGIVDHGKIVASDTPVNLKKIVSGTDGSGFELEIPNLQERMLSSLQELKSVRSVVQENPTHVIIRARGSESFDEIIDNLRNHGAKILMIKNLEPTLEDVFLHLTGREARETVSNNETNKRGFGPHGRRKRKAKRSR
jgi:ABC-2 type transport system ATP-binding protein